MHATVKLFPDLYMCDKREIPTYDHDFAYSTLFPGTRAIHRTCPEGTVIGQITSDSTYPRLRPNSCFFLPPNQAFAAVSIIITVQAAPSLDPQFESA